MTLRSHRLRRRIHHLNSSVLEFNSDLPDLNSGVLELGSSILELNSRTLDLSPRVLDLNSGLPTLDSGFLKLSPGSSDRRNDNKIRRFLTKKRHATAFGPVYTVLTQPKHARWKSHNDASTRKVKHSMRIIVPANPDGLITLAKAISAKHTALGAASPLNAIQDIAKLAPQTVIAETNNASAKTLSKQAETATQARDVALGQDGQLTPGTVRYFVDSARDILAGANKGNEKKLGDWGFVVDDSPAPKKAPKKKLDP